MRCAVLGDPIAHSLSPTLHRAGYAAVGLDWQYDAIRVTTEEFPEFVLGCGPEWRGLSLTMPHKRSALAITHGTVTDRARLAGGVNTLVFADGGLLADNTDLPGAVAAVRERFDGPITGGTVLGGGATAASTGLALCELGARTIRVLARSSERAEPTARAIAAHPRQPHVEVLPLTAEVLGEVVVSTVPAAAQDADLLARCADVPVVFEALYDPWPTPLAASAAGRVLVGGLDLLVHQAALQFELFTGVPGPLAAMRAAGEEVLAARQAAR